MRIISGQFRSRRLLSPPAQETRPITDRVKESVFNLLRGRIEDANMLDLFSGTGSIGLEAISRGAAKVLFVERHRACARILKENIQAFDVEEACEVFTGDALGSAYLARVPQPLNLVFADPPYELMLRQATADAVIGQLARIAPLMDEDGFLMLRTPWPVRPWIKKSELQEAAAPPKSIALEHPDLIGPETHTYNHMAVHFYQPNRGAGTSTSA